MEPKKTSRTAAVECEEFRARHAEYVDGMVTTLAAARLAAHADECASCARYDRVVRKGAALVRDMPGIEPSADFAFRLQHRIFHMQDERALVSARPTAGAAAALGVAALIALVAWSPVLFSASEARTARSTAATAALPQGPAAPGALSHMAIAGSAMNPGTPVDAYADNLPAYIGGSATAWYPATAAPQRATLAAFPGPHSPLIVTPPAHRSVRTVSTGYGPVE